MKLVEEKFQITPFPYAVYSNFDAVKKKERDMSLFKSRRTGLIDFFVKTFYFCPLCTDKYSLSFHRQKVLFVGALKSK